LHDSSIAASGSWPISDIFDSSLACPNGLAAPELKLMGLAYGNRALFGLNCLPGDTIA